MLTLFVNHVKFPWASFNVYNATLSDRLHQITHRITFISIAFVIITIFKNWLLLLLLSSLPPYSKPFPASLCDDKRLTNQRCRQMAPCIRRSCGSLCNICRVKSHAAGDTSVGTHIGRSMICFAVLFRSYCSRRNLNFHKSTTGHVNVHDQTLIENRANWGQYRVCVLRMQKVKRVWLWQLSCPTHRCILRLRGQINNRRICLYAPGTFWSV